MSDDLEEITSQVSAKTIDGTTNRSFDGEGQPKSENSPEFINMKRQINENKKKRK